MRIKVPRRNRVILVNMTPATLKQDWHAGVDNPIEDLEPFLPSDHYSCLGEPSELIRGRLPAHLCFTGYRPNAELVRTNERMKYPEP